MGDGVSMIGGESECGRRTPIVTDDDEALESEMVAHQTPQIVSDSFLVVALRGTRGIAKPAQSGRDQKELVRRQRHQAAPLVPGLRPSMDKNQGAALAERHVMQPHPFQIRVVMLEIRRTHRLPPLFSTRCDFSSSGRSARYDANPVVSENVIAHR